jgi:hypothetical protein
MFLSAVAFGAEPARMPMSLDPVVGDRAGQVALVGLASPFAGADVRLTGKLSIASRVAVAVRASSTVAEFRPIVGARVGVEVLDEASAPLGLGATLAYEKVGFDGFDAQLELGLSASRRLGEARLVANVGAARDVEEDEGSVSGGLAALYALSPAAAVGLDSRAEVAVGEVEHEDREDRRGWDLLAGPTVMGDVGAVGGFAFAGVEARGGDERGASAGVAARLGVDVTF